MCIREDSPKSRMKKSIAAGDNDEDHRRSAVVSPSASQSQSPLQSPLQSQSQSQSSLSSTSESESASPDDDEGEVLTKDMRTTAYAYAAHESGTPATVETILPNVVWLEHILPYLDRPAWNALMEASKELYKLVIISKLTADYKNLGPAVAQPPWPTNLSFRTKSGGQDQAIESFTISHDGEFLACGSVIGSIDIWNLRTGKLFKKTNLLGNEEAEARAQRPNYYASGNSVTGSMERRSTPIGNVLKFSPKGYTLACGFENRVFVWDFGEELQRRDRRRRKIRNRHHPTNEMLSLVGRNRNPSYAFPQQPQLRDDSLEQQNCVHHLPDPESPAHRVYASRRQLELLRKQEEQEERELYQTLEIECRKGTIYEVTYLGFSSAESINNSNSNTSAGNRLIARYGKMAYIWTKTAMYTKGERSGHIGSGSVSPTKSFAYVLTHRIALTSSRCQMVANPALTCLAVATNGGGSMAASRRRTNGGEGLSIDAASSTSKTKEGKGIIHVWDLGGTPLCESHQQDQKQQQSRSRSISTVTSDCGTKIVAYPNHVVRGLEFLEVGDTTTTGSGTCLVSASLQGEVKFWKKHQLAPKHPRDRFNNCNNRPQNFEEKHDDDGKDDNDKNEGETDSNNNDQNKAKYICVYQFQSPGKIFSLASWSSVLSGYGKHNFTSDHSGKILLAAGEARGQVRVWKVSPLSLLSTSSPSASASSAEVSLECQGRSRSRLRVSEEGENDNITKQQRLEECLSIAVGDHVHYDNIKLLAFTPNGKSLAVSRAYDARIWFQTVWQ